MPMAPDDSGEVDVTLIRWMLSMTPAERLATLEEFADFVQEARDRDAQRQSSLDSSDAH
jgi:hypothetical protein